MQTTRGTSLSDSTKSQSEAEGSTGSPRPRRIAVLIAIALAAYALDVVSKSVVVATLQGEEPVRLLGGLLTLRETRNSGAAFSIGAGYTLVFTVIACGVVVAILRTARNLRSLPWAVCLGLMLGGAFGNLTDRMLRAPAPLKGHVVDWIELPHWPVFNLADSAIVCGGVLAVLLAARGLQIDGTRITGKDDEPAADEPAADEPAADAPAKDQGAEAQGTEGREPAEDASVKGAVPAADPPVKDPPVKDVPVKDVLKDDGRGEDGPVEDGSAPKEAS
ncbi:MULTISPECIES: signal peptidase II [Thermomonosporaceae]|uniref:signal peptidase II n=1 Tax=Thermomonosporaceae TaxID=2012 RepID=UPI00255AFA97|nr:MULTISPECIES: signal peptidase II [Thermomonosporaceae]MDL4770995.1 signal peptidase II [Actinomadura xylanilytica]